MVGIADALVDGHLLFFEYLFILFWHVEGVVTRQCEECCHEGLFHITHLHAEILQERFVPDSPPVVGIGRTIRARIGFEVLLAIALLEARGSREALEAQAGGRGTVEEGRFIAQTVEACCHTAEMIRCVGGSHKGLYKHGKS